MRNKIMTIIFLLFIILLLIVILNGIHVRNFKILSVSELKNKNQELEERIEEASILTSVEYPEVIDKLEETYEKCEIQKQKYEEISGFTKQNKKQIYETKQYDIGYLWKIVGKYATQYNLTIGMDIKKGTRSNLYDLYFTVSGQYVNISQFIANIENNSDLYFRIYNFSMSGNSATVASSFVVKNVNIDPDTLISTTTTSSDLTTESDELYEQ